MAPLNIAFRSQGTTLSTITFSFIKIGIFRGIRMSISTLIKAFYTLCIKFASLATLSVCDKVNYLQMGWAYTSTIPAKMVKILPVKINMVGFFKSESVGQYLPTVTTKNSITTFISVASPLPTFISFKNIFPKPLRVGESLRIPTPSGVSVTKQFPIMPFTKKFSLYRKFTVFNNAIHGFTPEIYLHGNNYNTFTGGGQIG